MGLIDRLNSINNNNVDLNDKKELKNNSINEIEKETEKEKQKQSEKTHLQKIVYNTSNKQQTGKEKELKNKIQKTILTQFKNDDVEKIISEIDSIALEIIKKDGEYLGDIDRKAVIDEIINDLTGFGPITPLLKDEDISEVMVNGPHRVYVERKGKVVLTDVQFRNDEHVMHIIEKIVSPLGRRIDESSPMVDARLPDGSRVNAIIPPLALKGPTITIRKFSKDPFTIENLISFGTLTRDMAIFIDACVKARLNIFISGGTGSGKTTTLNVLSSFIPDDERIITIEDAAELQLGQDHVISLESRPANIEGTGAITIRDLVKNSLRMRPERIVIGEVRGGEALDMLQAMNTGHDGSLATGHSNSPRDMIARLETMVLMAGMELPVRAIRQQISGAIDLIIQQSRLSDGSRRIVSITEVQGMEGEVVVLQDIFTFKQQGKDQNGKLIGKMISTGIRPKFYDKLLASGIQVPDSIFQIEEW
ncbi:CpaF family protein [Clostridium grantii]|uniref:Pilus assembly protein CpaF n=1 Tax=Clostridium grantii DSM 8605 TaxID=1121316 RepID=A0A1M5X6K3_9CLOT|nr:CpaF family protein [Clostridium grantii]SHH95419.1 pilus assembly protein CpaF [Clostridium grantii DSM 8605]